MCKNREAIRLLRVLEVLSSDILPLFLLALKCMMRMRASRREQSRVHGQLVAKRIA